jgi:hypothetical protein
VPAASNIAFVSPATGVSRIGGRITREGILRAGQNGNPWEFVPLGLAALRVLPEDADVRLCLAAAYGKLGLPTPGMEQLDRLPESVQAEPPPSVIALRAAMRALPVDRVPIDELQRMLVRNLDTLRGRDAATLDLRSHLEAWCARASKREHFRARSGDIVWRAAGDATSWERLSNQAEQAAGLKLPHEQHPAPAYPTWYAIEGADPPWMFARACASTSGRPDGHSPRIILVQAGIDQLLDGLAQADLTRWLAEPRTRVFAGPHAGEQLDTFIRAEALRGVRIATSSIGLPTTLQRIDPPASVIVARASDMAATETARARASVTAIYAHRDRSWWSTRFAAARADPGGADQLRVLIATSRLSTFLRHSAADLAGALKGAGCEVRVFMEPDNHTLQDPLASLLAITEFKPDLVLIPNYLRRDVRESVPAGVPFVSWIQDSMPHLFDAAAGASMGELDFIVGNVAEEMFQKFDYPRGAALSLPMAVSATKFHPGPVDRQTAARHACEIAYVSHQSETPEGMLRRRIDETGGAGDSPSLVRAMSALFERVRAVVDRPIADGSKLLLLRIATAEELSRAGLPDDNRTVAAMMTTLTMPLADRRLRHQTLEWAAEIAQQRGWRMHLYGRGWESHPTLAPLARGELEHGEDLRACYQTARIHLHISLHSKVHQRVFECAMSGGLPICRLQADDLSTLEYLAAARASRASEPDACDPWRSAALGYRYFGFRPASSESGVRYSRLLAQLGLPEPEMLWLNQVHAERLRGSSAEAIDGEGQTLWDLWPDPGSLMFHDRDSMLRLLTRAIEDSAWRDESSRMLSARAKDTVSYDAFARAVLGFVETGLVTDRAARRRWYDGSGEIAASRRPGTGA